MKSKQEIKKFFENGDIPNQEQFWDWQDSYWHKDEKIPSDKVDIDLSQKADLVGGKVPAAQLPSYVDDVIEFNSFTALPIQGEAGKIYVNTDSNKIYRWTGTIYIDITQGDVGTLQAVTERGSSTDKFINIQGVSYGGSSSLENIVIGGDVHQLNSQSNYTIAIGKNANPSGTDNVVVGYSSITQNDSSSIGNVVVGNYAMQQAQGASENVVVGYNAFLNATNSYGNTIVGTYSGSGYGSGTSLNIILGCNSGGLASNSYNNTIIGNFNLFGNTILQNKLFIHNNAPGFATLSQGLISGDFVDRYVNINGKFSVTPGQMPSSDGSFTKNIVAKPDGTFGWENKVEYIPLEGAPINKPVTGDIYVKDSLTYTRLSPGFIYCSDLSDNGTVISTASVKFLEANQGTADFTKYGITTLEGEFTISCYKPNARGLSGHFDYTENIEDLDYVQKKYVDKKQSHSATEVKTGATWINGKPIYRKTVVYDTIPSNGEIDITVDFKDVEMIVSNQMFTEWYAMDVAFAGNQWRGQAFITLQPDMVKIEDIKNLGYNYSLIDSFTLTLEYTKTTD